MWILFGILLAGGATTATRLLWPRPLNAIDDSFRAMPEVAAVHDLGYEIRFSRQYPSKRYEKWVFAARLRGGVVGRLDVDLLTATKRLYVANVYVVEKHGNRGLATALLLCAVKATECTVLTTSGRTRQGVRFFAKNRPVLQRYGVELRDQPPAQAGPYNRVGRTNCSVTSCGTSVASH